MLKKLENNFNRIFDYLKLFFKPSNLVNRFSFVFCLLFVSNNYAQLFTQDFSSSTVVADYDDPAPTTGQFNSLTSSGASMVLSIVGGKLRFARTGNAGNYTRTTDFSPIPTTMRYKFDLTVSGNTVAQTTAATWYVGSITTTLNGIPANSESHSRIGLNFTATNGTFSFRDVDAGANSATFAGTQTIEWYINNSGAAIQYSAPDGTCESLANDTWDLWVGNTKVFNDKSATTSTQSLADIKFLFNNGTANVDFDNILINPITIGCAPTLTTGAITGANFDVTCIAGDAGSVAFTSTGSYDPDNNYQVELSNSAGSFASPTLIGTLASNANSGSIPINIPEGTITSSNYLLRVVSTNPVITGSNSPNFTITLTGGPCNTITTGSTNAASYSVSCTAGAAGSVTYTSTGTFLAGNVFTVQLSDASGNFGSPLNIGTLTSTSNSATINFGLPSGLSGAGYRVRVVSSNPETEGAVSPTFSITLTGGPCGPLFLETFNEADNSTSGNDNANGVSWATTCPNCLDAGDYNKVESGKLRIKDSNGPARFTTGSINTSTCTDAFYIKMNITAVGGMEPCAPSPADNAIDFVALEYKINGGAWIGAPGHYDCGATDGFNSPVVIYDINDIGSTTYNSGCIDPANTVELRITAQSWASSEIWEIDNIEVGCNSCVILPITLTYFDVYCKDENALVFNWQTVSETNNDYFTLVRTTNGKEFEEVKQIKGSGNTTMTKNYTVEIPNNRTALSYFYCLKQTDYNGNSTYSNLINTDCSDEEELYVFPNPSPGSFIIKGYSRNAVINVLDNIGQLISVIQTENEFTKLDLSNQANGIYFLKIESTYKSEVIKVVKKE